MSSRLILLPKKSYTPWNAENVAKCEEIEAAAAAEAAEHARRDAIFYEERRKQKMIPNSVEGSGRHVNLFEKEERSATTAPSEASDSRRRPPRGPSLGDGVDWLGGWDHNRPDHGWIAGKAAQAAAAARRTERIRPAGKSGSSSVSKHATADPMNAFYAWDKEERRRTGRIERDRKLPLSLQSMAIPAVKNPCEVRPETAEKK
eukprot:CAMPEP_0113330352 /NCGR_PEP_ID=MMETSP0010_2-20120614/21557_1 /TAXON_ID=216773 ORGANISM="Corethron hystrix, Strain 308" /NCGR_SAMPLE_ID=MMETSP0010_2 /ASSEMBLY_ACC=CAM_ASM_000155 /LENGTH=202 /DNA_ID=CAMNT_0000192841 /DNA_START=94 /DNA_END=699 /DNA_ORIENTATION=+ /assembly_acc=CAM_ASM_000155